MVAAAASACKCSNQNKYQTTNQGEREGGGTSASERVAVGEALVELRPRRPEGVERPWRRSPIGHRRFSLGGGHHVGEEVLRVHLQISPASFRLLSQTTYRLQACNRQVYV